MKFHKIFIFFILIFLASSCSKKEEKISVIEQTNLEMQMIEAYNEGLKQLEEGEFRFAAKKFNEVELLYPQSAWAARSTLMAAYSYYSDFYYNDAIIELERFLDNGFNSIIQLCVSTVAIGCWFFYISPLVASITILPVPIILLIAFFFQKNLSFQPYQKWMKVFCN